MNSVYAKEKYDSNLNCTYKVTITQIGYNYEVTVYLDGYLLQQSEAFESVADAVVHALNILSILCE